jgi:hypothetical protein
MRPGVYRQIEGLGICRYGGTNPVNGVEGITQVPEVLPGEDSNLERRHQKTVCYRLHHLGKSETHLTGKGLSASRPETGRKLSVGRV